MKYLLQHTLLKPPLFLTRTGIPPECYPSLYNELNDSTRYWSNNDPGISTICDADTIFSNRWYRFTGAAGTMMATYCIPKESCNTHRAAWVDGAHPNVAYGLVSTSICMHWKRLCCEKSYPVDIRNCSGYYVYKLQKPSACSERYCGVNGERNILISLIADSSSCALTNPV